jgi:hypothetical protein
MDKPKPNILQVKAPSKWDILKEKSKHIKHYLKGRFVEGTQVTAAAKLPDIRTSKFDNGEYLRKHRIRRKRINKLKYKSRRKNRRGL